MINKICDIIPNHPVKFDNGIEKKIYIPPMKAMNYIEINGKYNNCNIYCHNTNKNIQYPKKLIVNTPKILNDTQNDNDAYCVIAWIKLYYDNKKN